MTNIGEQTSAPENVSPVPVTEPEGAESLWQQVETLLAIRKRNAVELGKVLNELHDLYAKPGYGTFTTRFTALGISRSSAYRWMGEYRNQVGLPPLRFTIDESEEIPIAASEFAVNVPDTESDEPAIETPPGEEQKQEIEPTIVPVRINLTPDEGRTWEVHLQRIVRFCQAQGVTRSDGRPIANRADAAFWAINAVIDPTVIEWEAQHEKR